MFRERPEGRDTATRGWGARSLLVGTFLSSSVATAPPWSASRCRTTEHPELVLTGMPSAPLQRQAESQRHREIRRKTDDHTVVATDVAAAMKREVARDGDRALRLQRR